MKPFWPGTHPVVVNLGTGAIEYVEPNKQPTARFYTLADKLKKHMAGELKTETCLNCGHGEFKLVHVAYKLFNRPEPLDMNQIRCAKCGVVAVTW